MPTNFDYFDLLRFLAPWKSFRRKKIDEVLNQLRQISDSHPNAKVSILAHSFGSYIVAEILAKDTSYVNVHRLAFCGSIVPHNHPFVWQLGNRIRTQVVNDIGTRDVWPALANSVTRGYGHTGTYGFRRHGVTDRRFDGLKHNQFFTPVFCKDHWIPFFKSGAVSTVATHNTESPPLWLRVMSVPAFKIKFVVPLLALGVLIWWKRDDLTQLFKLACA